MGHSDYSRFEVVSSIVALVVFIVIVGKQLTFTRARLKVLTTDGVLTLPSVSFSSLRI